MAEIRELTAAEMSRIKHGKAWKEVLAEYRPMWADFFAKNPTQEVEEKTVLGGARDWYDLALSDKRYNRQDEMARRFGITWQWASSASLLRLQADVLKSSFEYFRRDVKNRAKMRVA